MDDSKIDGKAVSQNDSESQTMNPTDSKSDFKGTSLDYEKRLEIMKQATLDEKVSNFGELPRNLELLSDEWQPKYIPCLDDAKAWWYRRKVPSPKLDVSDNVAILCNATSESCNRTSVHLSSLFVRCLKKLAEWYKDPNNGYPECCSLSIPEIKNVYAFPWFKLPVVAQQLLLALPEVAKNKILASLLFMHHDYVYIHGNPRGLNPADYKIIAEPEAALVNTALMMTKLWDFRDDVITQMILAANKNAKREDYSEYRCVDWGPKPVAMTLVTPIDDITEYFDSIGFRRGFCAGRTSDCITPDRHNGNNVCRRCFFCVDPDEVW